MKHMHTWSLGDLEGLDEGERLGSKLGFNEGSVEGYFLSEKVIC
jgi:hypothetical protein